MEDKSCKFMAGRQLFPNISVTSKDFEFYWTLMLILLLSQSNDDINCKLVQSAQFFFSFCLLWKSIIYFYTLKFLSFLGLLGRYCFLPCILFDPEFQNFLIFRKGMFVPVIFIHLIIHLVLCSQDCLRGIFFSVFI